MKEDIRHRLNLIRDSLIGVSYHLPDPEVILYPFLDNNLLLHQAPLVFTFWEGDKCVYSSLKDPDFLSRHAIAWGSAYKSGVPIRKTPFTLSVHQFPGVNTRNATGTIEIPVHLEATSLTRALLDKTDGFSLPDEFFTSLGASIASHRTRGSEEIGIFERVPHVEMDYVEVKAFLDPFRVALDDIFADSIRSEHLTIRKGSLQYPNIFAVVRTCPTSSRRYNGTFDYTAGLLLLSEMKSVLTQWCANTCLNELDGYHGKCPLCFSNADQCLTALEQPLGPHSRSVSDLVFSSGIVDFGRQAREEGWDASVAGDALDGQRRAMEQCVYPRGWRLFYIPVHVGGTPWLALFTFTPQDPASDPGAWHHNYSFYRDLAQKAAVLIRQEAHDAYVNLLAKRLVKHMESWVTPMTTIVSHMNQDAQRLSQVYPFPLTSFSEGRYQPNDIFIPGRGVVTLNFSPNPFFQRQVSWNLGDKQAVLRRCRDAIGDFTRIEQSIEINAVAQSSHLLKVPLRVLDSIASSTGGNKKQAMRRHIRRMLDLHDVASALMSEERRIQFRQQHKRTGSVPEIISILSNQYAASIGYLAEPAVSGNLAPRLKRLLEQKRIRFITHPAYPVEGSMVYYEPLVLAMFDGLLTNAIDAVDLSNPSILVEAVVGESGDKLFLCVENSTDINQARLSVLERNLNSPGPDMVGITELHWISKACWPELDVTSGVRLSWTTLDSPRRVVARAMIAEVSK